jgi:MATE family multidrug resistance protein
MIPAVASTERAMHGRVWRIAGPIVLSNMTVPLLGAVDTAVVGRLPDPANIGAVAVGAVIFNFLYWGLGFLRMGTSGLVAQAFGAGDRAALREWLGRALLLAAALSLLLLLLQWPAREIGFSLMQASPQVESLGRGYFDIRIWAAPATLANYVVLGWLLAVQRAKATFALQILMNGINIALDLLFVLAFGWGVAGVAVATVIAEYTAAAVGLAYIFGLLRGGGWRFAALLDRAKLLAMARINADIFIRTVCLILAFAYFVSAGGGLGDVVLAANAILLNLQSLMAYGLDGFAYAAEVLVGSAVGARDRRALRLAVRVSTLWAAGLSLVVAALYGAFGDAIVALFTTIEAVRAEAGRYLAWIALSPLLSVWSFQLDGIFIGATRTAEMRNGMILALAVYLIGATALVPAMGNHGLWLAFLIWMGARTLPLALWYPRIVRSIPPDALPDRGDNR